jgi:chromosome condensin MukBEF MukE localization factor
VTGSPSGARAARVRAVRAELRRLNRLSAVYTAPSPSAKFHAGRAIWMAAVKRLPQEQRDAQYERMADLLVNDALQIESNTSEREVA